MPSTIRSAHHGKQPIRDRTPVDMGWEYMAARFPVSIWVYDNTTEQFLAANIRAFANLT